MINKYIFLIALNSLMFVVKTSIEDEIKLPDFPEEGFDYNFNEEEDHYFKSSLKEYLVENKLFESERVIEPDELKKIFLDVITDDGPENSPENMRKSLYELAEYFVERYYNEKKQIRGKDIYDLFDINDISAKFSDIVGDTINYNNDYNEEEDDLDAMGEL